MGKSAIAMSRSTYAKLVYLKEVGNFDNFQDTLTYLIKTYAKVYDKHRADLSADDVELIEKLFEEEHLLNSDFMYHKIPKDLKDDIRAYCDENKYSLKKLSLLIGSKDNIVRKIMHNRVDRVEGKVLEALGELMGKDYLVKTKSLKINYDLKDLPDDLQKEMKAHYNQASMSQEIRDLINRCFELYVYYHNQEVMKRITYAQKQKGQNGEPDINEHIQQAKEVEKNLKNSNAC